MREQAEEEVGRLALEDVEVLVDGEIHGAAPRELQDHSLDHAKRDLGDDLENLEAPHLDRHADRADVEEIAEEHGEIVPEEVVDRALPAPHDGLVDDVVVDQSRGVDELRDRAVLRGLFALVAAGSRGQQQERRTDTFSAAAVDVAAARLDDLELALYLVANERLDRVEISLNRAEDVPEREGRLG